MAILCRSVCIIQTSDTVIDIHKQSKKCGKMWNEICAMEDFFLLHTVQAERVAHFPFEQEHSVCRPPSASSRDAR